MSNKKKLSILSSSKQLKIDNNPKLVIDQNYILDFTKCDVDDYPKSKIDFENIIETFQAFNKNNLASRDDHKLKKEDIGKNSGRIERLINTYGKVHSVDVGHRNGASGNMRLLYTKDTINAHLIYVLDCFIDTH